MSGHVLDLPLFDLKILSLYVWGFRPPSNKRFLATPVHIPNGISICSAAFAGLTVVTDRQTDRLCYSVCSNRPHPASAAMRPKTRIKVLASPELKTTEDPSYRHLRRVSETLIYGSCCLGRQFSFSLSITFTALDSDCPFWG